MNELRTRIQVGDDRRITGTAPPELPPGSHEAVIMLAPKPRKTLDLATFPTHDEPWDDSVSLRREDIYGDDGR